MQEEKVRDIERLITLDILGRGIVQPLYKNALSLQGEYPSLLAARKIKENLFEGSCALIATGFLVPPIFVQETDGPIGSISLARGFDQFCGANSVIVAEGKALPILKAVAYASSLNVIQPEEIEKAKHAVSLIEFPIKEEAAKEKAKGIIEKHNPSLIISVEKVGSNEAKVYHNMKGYDVSERAAKIESLFEEAKKRKIPSIGIGDGGNEIGMGKIKDTVKKAVPYGAKCQCDCGRGIAADPETDILVVATVSNWGAHAIIAALSLLMEKDLLHHPELEKKMLLEAAREGAIDAMSGYASGDCDGISAASHLSILQIMKEIIKK